MEEGFPSPGNQIQGSPSRNFHVEDIYSNSIRTYLAEIRSLKEQLKNQEKQLENEHESTKGLADICSQLERDKKELINQNNELKDHYNEAFIENQKLQTAIDNLAEQNQKLKSDLQEYKEESKGSFELQREVTQKYDSTRNKFRDAKEQIKKLNECLKSEQQKSTYLEQNSTNLVYKAEKYKARAKQLQQQLSVAEAHIRDTNDLTQQLKRRVQAVEDQARATMQNNSVIAEKENEINSLRNRLTEVELSNSKLSDKCDAITEALKHAQETIEETKQEYSTSVNITQRQQEDEITQFQERINMLEEKNRDLEDKLMLAQDDLNEAQRQLRSNSQQFQETLAITRETQKSQIAKLSEKLEKSQALCNEFSKQLIDGSDKGQQNLAEALERCANLEYENTQLKTNVKSQLEKLKELYSICDQMMKSKSDNKRSTDKSQREIEKYKKMVASLESENESLMHSIGELESLRKSVMELEREKDDLLERNSALETENEALKSVSDISYQKN